MNSRDVQENIYYWIEEDKVVEHIWVRIEEQHAWIGLTETGVELMGDLVYISPANIGQKIEKGKGVATLESSKWVGPISTPLEGEIADINESLVKNPSLINKNPFSHWIVKLKIPQKNIPKCLVTGAEGAKLYRKATESDLSDKSSA